MVRKSANVEASAARVSKIGGKSVPANVGAKIQASEYKSKIPSKTPQKEIQDLNATNKPAGSKIGGLKEPSKIDKTTNFKTP